MRRPFIVLAASLLACSSSSPAPSPSAPDAEAPDGSAPLDGATEAAAPADSGTEGGTGCTPGGDVVEVTGGCIRGATSGTLHTFFGVPFAAAPTGDRRWKAPDAPIAWAGVRDATAFSKACPQNGGTLSGQNLEWDEDCLYLNVWTSSLDASAKLPVMVWIHGGGLVNGSGTQPLYHGNYLVEKGGVVAVTINYRLAQLGYLGHPALAAERNGRSGNYGLLDQIAALEWIRANVARFGGDPANVTVYGESAGALSTCALLASPRAAGLFQRAGMESGGCPGYGTYVRPEKSAMAIEGVEEQGVRYAMALGCGNDANTLACMRAKSPTDVLAALPAIEGVLSKGERYGFTINGDALVDTPDARTASGASNQVPVMLGTNADEGTIFVGAILVPTDAAYSAYVHATFPGAAGDAILAQYPSASYASPKAALAALVTDAVFACPARRKARDLAKHGADVFLYQFTTVPSYAKSPTLGSFHGSEIDFVMGTLRDRTAGAATADEIALSDAMLGYWTRFAKAGDPSGTPTWPKYDRTGDASLQFATPVAAVTGLKSAKCDFWDSL